MTAWINAYTKACSSAKINYNPTGSGAGVSQFNAGQVQFAGSDSALDPTKGEVAAAQKQCKGECTTVTMKRACAAMSVDLANPCGAYGYAVKPKISATLNAATRECYKFGGKECVIRAWACDAKG